MNNFADKFILITGAGKGIGFELAKILNAQGAKLILHTASDASIEKLKHEFGEEIHIFFKADFTKVHELEKNWNNQINQNIVLSGYVNCVGMRSRRPLNLLYPEHVISVLSSNVAAFIEMVRIISSKKIFKSGLRIVTISSISAHSGSSGVTAYAASKAGMEAAVRCLAKELFKKNIYINTLVCGQVQTEAYEELMMTKDINKDVVLDRQYMGLASVTEISEIILFLLSNQSRYINGSSIMADGGYL